MELTNYKFIKNMKLVSKTGTLWEISKILSEQVHTVIPFTVYNNLLQREWKMSTGPGGGVAIPHATIPNLNQTIIIVIRNIGKPIEWESLDEKPVDLIIAILTPEYGRYKHFNVLSSLSKQIIDPKKIKLFRKEPNEKVAKIINAFPSAKA